MGLMLFIRMFLFITGFTSGFTHSSIVVEIDKEMNKVDVIKTKLTTGGTNKTVCPYKSDRAIVVGKKLKCVSQNEIKSKMNGTNNIQDVYSKCQRGIQNHVKHQR